MISSNKSICTLHITDTTGSHQFPAMQRLSISKGHAFILVFSIAAKQSLEELKSILELVNEVIWSQFDVKALKLKVRHAQLTKCQSSWDIYKRLSTSSKLLISQHHMFENYPKCIVSIFQCRHFQPIVVLLKLNCLVTLFDHLSGVQKPPNWLCLAWKITKGIFLVIFKYCVFWWISG